MTRPRSRPRSRDERGSATPLIVGFAVVLLLAIVVVVDASAAFLERQGLATMAEGAALQGADVAAEGGEVYAGGLGQAPLELTAARARSGVRAYLSDIGAHREYPGLRYDVAVRGDRIVVSLTAPVDLPLTFPGVAATTDVTGSGSAVADPA